MKTAVAGYRKDYGNDVGKTKNNQHVCETGTYQVWPSIMGKIKLGGSAI